MDDLNRFVRDAIKNSVRIANKRNDADVWSLSHLACAFRPILQAGNNRVDTPFNLANQRWIVGCEIFEDLV